MFYFDKRIFNIAASNQRVVAYSVVIALASTAGCAQRPHLQVEKGTDPAYINKNVRFRTTYYFRVVDMCDTGNNDNVIAIDSLYRYRMTGKASPSAVKVKFESGTLTAQQIDPFGAQVAFDKKNNHHYFLSAQEGKSRVRREELIQSIRDLLELHLEITTKNQSDNIGVSGVVSTLEREIALLGSLLREDPLPLSHSKFDPVLRSARYFKAEAQRQYDHRVGKILSALAALSFSSTRLSDWFNMQDALVEQRTQLAELKDQLDNSTPDLTAEKLAMKQSEHDMLEATFDASASDSDQLRAQLSTAFNSSAVRLAELKAKSDKNSWGDGKDLPVNTSAVSVLLRSHTSADVEKLKPAVGLIDDVPRPEPGKDKDLPEWVRSLVKTFPEQKRLEKAIAVVGQIEEIRSPNSVGSQPSYGGPGTASLSCDRTRRGFQILGPEGWRTFNQDERLLLAMTTSAQPLVQSLTSLSQRVVDSRRPDANIAKLAVAKSRQSLTDFSLQLALNRQSSDTSDDAALIEKLKKIIITFWPEQQSDGDTADSVKEGNDDGKTK